MRFLETLSSTSRTAIPVREFGRVAIKSLDDGLGLDRHFVFGPPREVNELFGMAQRKSPASAHMSGVGGRSRIPCANRFRHGGIADNSRPSSVANAFELTIPAVKREPNFHSDIGIACRLDSHSHAAELGKFFIGIGPSSRGLPLARRRELPGWYDLSRCDSGVLQRNLCQAIARGTKRGCSEQERQNPNDASHR